MAEMETLTPARSEDAVTLPRHAFWGRHFLASYGNCNARALGDVTALVAALTKAAVAAGATVLSSHVERFAGGGCTAVLLLAESHATVHTYPEHNACFADLFTCGAHSRTDAFDRVLREYLEPQVCHTQTVVRE